KPQGCVLDAGCKAKERIVPLSSVAVRIASVRGRINRPDCGREGKIGERARRQRGINKFRYCLHVFFPFIILLQKFRTEVGKNFSGIDKFLSRFCYKTRGKYLLEGGRAK